MFGNNCFGGAGCIWIIIIILLLCGYGGCGNFGCGNNGCGGCCN